MFWKLSIQTYLLRSICKTGGKPGYWWLLKTIVFQLDISIEWLTVSKGFSRSTKTPHEKLFFSEIGFNLFSYVRWKSFFWIQIDDHIIYLNSQGIFQFCCTLCVQIFCSGLIVVILVYNLHIWTYQISCRLDRFEQLWTD